MWFFIEFFWLCWDIVLIKNNVRVGLEIVIVIVVLVEGF